MGYVFKTSDTNLQQQDNLPPPVTQSTNPPGCGTIITPPILASHASDLKAFIYLLQSIGLLVVCAILSVTLPWIGFDDENSIWKISFTGLWIGVGIIMFLWRLYEFLIGLESDVWEEVGPEENSLNVRREGEYELTDVNTPKLPSYSDEVREGEQRRNSTSGNHEAGTTNPSLYSEDTPQYKIPLIAERGRRDGVSAREHLSGRFLELQLDH
ncbi:hypothetical protein B0J14DRAFT_607680 [Halenospora varia]|nr:hypothetical protein B0J14DRAFT_607680 [Halenospora varia]